MVVSDKLKQLIFKRLYKELNDVEIIPHDNSIWFINRETKYWYFELGKEYLFWRYDFFNSFFEIFSMDKNEYSPIIFQLVSEVLNNLSRNVNFTPIGRINYTNDDVNKVLDTSPVNGSSIFFNNRVGKVLNNQGMTPEYASRTWKVGEILNSKSVIPGRSNFLWETKVGEVLGTKSLSYQPELVLDMVLNQK